MKRFLISFKVGAMDYIPENELAEVDRAAHEVVQAAKAAGVWIFGGGMTTQESTLVSIEGASKQGPDPKASNGVGGFSIVEVETLDEAIDWASKVAKACRCEQEVREIMFDPES